MCEENPWNSLEVAKLLVGVLTPLAVVVFGFLVQRTLAHQDRSWRANEQLANRRLAVYNDVRKELNRIHCFVNDIGPWKDENPESIIRYKRDVDETMHTNRAIWQEGTFQAYLDFMDTAFAMYGGVGKDARIKTTSVEKKVGIPKWNTEWEQRITGEVDHRENAAYDHLIELIGRDVTVQASAPPPN